MEKLSKREKVMIGLGLVGATAAGIVIYKQHDIILKALLDKVTMEKEIGQLKMENQEIKERLDFVEFLVIESECIPKALQNGNNKLSRVQSKIVAATERLLKVPDDKQTQQWLENNKAEEAKLLEHIAKAMKLDEAVKADQNIYAK